MSKRPFSRSPTVRSRRSWAGRHDSDGIPVPGQRHAGPRHRLKPSIGSVGNRRTARSYSIRTGRSSFTPISPGARRLSITRTPTPEAHASTIATVNLIVNSRPRPPGPEPRGSPMACPERHAARRDPQRSRDVELLARGGHNPPRGLATGPQGDLHSRRYPRLHDDSFEVLIDVARAVGLTSRGPTRRTSSMARHWASASLDATAAVGGTFTYVPGAGSVLGVGNGQILTVYLTPHRRDRLSRFCVHGDH